MGFGGLDCVERSPSDSCNRKTEWSIIYVDKLDLSASRQSLLIFGLLAASVSNAIGKLTNRLMVCRHCQAQSNKELNQPN